MSTEWQQKGTVAELMENRMLTQSEVLDYFANAALAVEQIHYKGFSHGNISAT